jgi:putative ATPase
MGIERALDDIKNNRLGDVPRHLMDTSYKGAENLGRGKGYKYPHDFNGNYVNQDYLPINKRDKRFYFPTENGYEKIIKERLSRWNKK